MALKDPKVTSARQVPMRVLVLGLSRTGTDSIRQALLQLGYNNTFHGFVLAVERPYQCKQWMKALDRKFNDHGAALDRDELDELLGDCQAICDAPGYIFAEELLTAYPEAKVVLTTRDKEEWFKSVNTSIVAENHTKKAVLVDWLAYITRSPYRHTRPMFLKAFEGYFGRDFEVTGRLTFDRHYARIRQLCSGRQLEYSVTEGWGPLCDFLEHEIPQQSFPHGNNAVQYKSRVHELINTEVTRLFQIAILWSVGSVVCIVCLFYILG